MAPAQPPGSGAPGPGVTGNARDDLGPLILFAPGAGAPASSPWMTAWADRLSFLGQVVRFDYPYQRSAAQGTVAPGARRRRPPDRLPALVAAHREALSQARARSAARRATILCGKSMGSRVGCHLALEPDQVAAHRVAALVCLGYPLRSPGGALRDEVLCALTLPVLFVQGSRDPLCPLPELASVRARMRAPSRLHVVEDGDHSLELRSRDLRARGRTQKDVDDEVLGAIAAFLAAPGPG